MIVAAWTPRLPLVRRLALTAVLALVLVGCSSSSADRPSPSSGSSAGRAAHVVRPSPGVGFDYQIGGAYKPPSGVRALSRDRGAAPARGLYNVCYVNAFQAQPDALDWWRRAHPELLLRDAHGRLVIDQDWDEPLLDIRTAAKRARLARIVGGWIDGCAHDGFQAVEPDNLDSYERSGGLIDAADAVAFARLIAGRAHAAGLAVGQKNAAGLLSRHAATGFDFAVAEECARYEECGAYASAYGDRVFVIEYRKTDFTRACRAWSGRLSIVLRDRDVRPEGEKGYVRQAC
ncbi:endo alpha-1,4 polygalactosaminidase [Streptomyces beihaiensis]|uniref:Endo alpha-1,4 polygalactosaminidase n=1 Tax=Streptomyces beihaiensis TaxID=2984495 RepID=A0ABT3TXT1_9ACTN|nr:endo alpha-1,4 polygalactosaminidase [Streptomyces beihaiensis]MCX3061620.1 endo alpha-1,4 polygalactosaminidase [Streptomyces beihaiensis]